MGRGGTPLKQKLDNNGIGTPLVSKKGGGIKGKLESVRGSESTHTYED